MGRESPRGRMLCSGEQHRRVHITQSKALGTSLRAYGLSIPANAPAAPRQPRRGMLAAGEGGMSTFKAFWEGLAKGIGEHVATVVWAAIVLAAPLVAWFTAPATYTFRLTRLQIAGVVFALLL